MRARREWLVLGPKREGLILIFCDLMLSEVTSFLKFSLKFLKSFRRYEDLLGQY